MRHFAWGLMSLARPDMSVPVRRLRCHALIFWPIAFLALLAHAREERDEHSPSAVRRAGPEGVDEEIEAGVRRFSSAVAVFAVDHLGFVRVQLETGRPEPGGDGGQKILCLCLVSQWAKISSA